MKWIALVFTCLVVAGCASVRVKQDYDAAVDFERLKTYDWQQHAVNNSSTDTSLVYERIRTAVDNVLGSAGYRKKTSGPVDFLVDYDYAVVQQPDSGTSMSFFSGGFGGFGVGVGQRMQDYQEIETMGIKVLDPETSRLMWKGSVDHEYRRRLHPEDSARDIQQTVEEILARFPPSKTRSR